MAEPLPAAGASARVYTIETQTAGDGYCWRYRRYRPRGPARAHVVALHGIQSHGGWYEYSCGRLAAAGFAVSFLDRRGAGLNHPERGDAPSFRRLLDDIAEFLRPLRPARACEHGASRPGPPSLPDPLPVAPGSALPVYLLGISWGSKLAVALERRHPGLANGLALLCPGFFPQVRPPLVQRLRIAWARLATPRKLFPIPLDDPELFTATPLWQQFIRDDPLSLRQASARLLFESARLDLYLRPAPRHVRVPSLLLLAQNDRIIKNGPTRRYVERFACTDKEIIEYPGAHHTLEFEPEPDRFVDDLQQWLQRHSDRWHEQHQGCSPAW